MNFKKLLATSLALLIVAVPAASAADTFTTPDDAITVMSSIQPRERVITNGNYSGDVAYSSTWTLDRNNGKYLNFYVENNGTSSVTLTINGSGARTLAPGQSGHIYRTVNSTSQTFTVRCAATVSGNAIDIFYALAQRDTQ